MGRGGTVHGPGARRQKKGTRQQYGSLPPYHEAMDAERAYLFRHALLRDAAYQLQLPGDRARLHAVAFEAIEELAGGGLIKPGATTSGPSPFTGRSGTAASKGRTAATMPRCCSGLARSRRRAANGKRALKSCAPSGNRGSSSAKFPRCAARAGRREFPT